MDTTEFSKARVWERWFEQASTNWPEVKSEIWKFVEQLMIHLRLCNCASIREFFVLRDRNEKPGAGLRFAFYESDDADLSCAIDLLLEAGWISQLESEEQSCYRMREEFASHLLDGWPERRWPD